MYHRYQVDIETEEENRGYHRINVYVSRNKETPYLAEYHGSSLNLGLASAVRAIKKSEKAEQ